MLLGHSGYLLISSKVVQLSTLIINHDKFFSEQIDSFSRNCTTSSMLEKNLTEGQI